MERNSEERRECLSKFNASSNSPYYARDYRLFQAVKTGDLETLRQITDPWFEEEEPFVKSPITGVDELGSYKNHLEVLNMICRIAAIDGGLVNQHTYILSRRFSILIEKGKTIDYLEKNIFHTIFHEYGTAVRDFSTTGYSETMREIILYIHQHITEELTLTNIAEAYGMHPVHLARKFKQETDTTFVEYTNIQRINLAIYLFHLDKYSLNEVADLSGFNSHSYFTKVFKKTTGLTPTKYVREIFADIK